MTDTLGIESHETQDDAAHAAQDGEEISSGDPRIRRANAEAARYRVERNTARQEIMTLQGQLSALHEQLQASQQQAETERLSHLRLQIATQAGLPIELAGRLQGQDETSLRADAAALVQALQARSPLTEGAAAGLGAGNGGKGGPRSQAQQIVDRINGASLNLFDPQVQRHLGGGVMVNPAVGLE
jgi:hypothetical protein